MPGKEDKKVKDIMLPLQDYATVFWENSLRDAMFVLKNTFYSGCRAGSQAHRSILVFDKQKRMVGTLSFKDIISSLWAMEKDEQWDGKFTKLCLEQASRKVKEVMRPIPSKRLQIQDSIIDAIDILMNQDLEMVPVEEKGNIVGMIRTVEIFKEVSELVEKEKFS